MAISDYSTTPASNTSLSGIDITGTTGKVKDGDNAIRQIMADIKAGVPYLSSSQFLFESTDGGTTAAPVLNLYRNSASPAASDILGNITFNGEDSAGNTQEYASIETVIVDATSTSEDGQLDFYATKAGTRTKFLSMTATATALTGAAAYTLDAPTTISNSAAGTMLTVTSTDAGAASGPNLELYRDSASPAASDTLSAIFFYGRDSAANKQEYAAIVGGIFDATSGSEDSYMTLRTVAAGATNAVLILGATAAGVAAPSSLGLPLGQISFPATANPSADANTLDDYEEGAWTPALTFGGNAVGMTFGSQAGTYTKIGNALFISGNFTLTAKGSSTGIARVTGFPFNLPAAQGAVITYYTDLATITGPVSVFTNNSGGATTADLVLGGAAGIAAVGHANFTNTSTIYFTLAIRGVS